VLRLGVIVLRRRILFAIRISGCLRVECKRLDIRGYLKLVIDLDLDSLRGLGRQSIVKIGEQSQSKDLPFYPVTDFAWSKSFAKSLSLEDITNLALVWASYVRKEMTDVHLSLKDEEERKRLREAMAKELEKQRLNLANARRVKEHRDRLTREASERNKQERPRVEETFELTGAVAGRLMSLNLSDEEQQVIELRLSKFDLNSAKLTLLELFSLEGKPILFNELVKQSSFDEDARLNLILVFVTLLYLMQDCLVSFIGEGYATDLSFYAIDEQVNVFTDSILNKE